MLMELMQKMLTAIADNESHRSLIQIAHEIQNYALFHFFSEEKYMREAGYPGLADHVELHIDLISRLSEKLSDLEANKYSLQELDSFFDEYFVGHFLQEDAKFVNYLSGMA